MKALSISILFLSLLFGTPSSEEAKGSLLIRFSNIEIENGEIEVCIFNSPNTFLKKRKSFLKKRVKVNDSQAIVKFENIPYGSYAAVSYHDTNNNRCLDKSMMGFPAEPYSFSKPFNKKHRKPLFNEVMFNFDSNVEEIQMKFQRY